MILDYIYHSGFAIEAEGVTLIIDYYKDSSETELNKGIVHDRLLQRPGKLYVLASHFHPDHFNREVLTWISQSGCIYCFRVRSDGRSLGEAPGGSFSDFVGSRSRRPSRRGGGDF